MSLSQVTLPVKLFQTWTGKFKTTSPSTVENHRVCSAGGPGTTQ